MDPDIKNFTFILFQNKNAWRTEVAFIRRPLVSESVGCLPVLCVWQVTYFSCWFISKVRLRIWLRVFLVLLWIRISRDIGNDSSWNVPKPFLLLPHFSFFFSFFTFHFTLSRFVEVLGGRREERWNNIEGQKRRGLKVFMVLYDL